MAVLVGGAAVTHLHPRITAAAAILISIVALAHRRLLAWHSLLGLIILTILFIPIKRYNLPASLPFNLEVYRIVVAFVALLWIASLLIDPRVRLRRSGLEAPIASLIAAVVLSLLANPKRITAVGTTYEIKQFTFFLSYVVVFYLVVTLARAPSEIDFLARVLAVGGALLGISGVVESSIGYNVFNHLSTVFPLLHRVGPLPSIDRGGRLRVYGPAQHPIAFGTALAMLLPLGIYKMQSSRNKFWWLVTILILLGVMASRSRTAILMLIVILIIYIVLRPREMRRRWPAIVPALIVIHFALPGAIGTAFHSFFPAGGIVAQQTNAPVGSGRLATLGPALDAEFKPNPILGEGFGTRISGKADPGQPAPNAPILDDGWLGVLLELGVVGTLGLLWVFTSCLRRMGRAAKIDNSPRGALLVATTAAVAGYAVGMFTYDAMGFVQVTFLLYIFMGIGMAAVASRPKEWVSPQLARSGEPDTPGLLTDG
jgi:hypothetical protein